MLLKFVYANYNSDVRLTFTLYFKRGHDDAWESLIYNLDSTQSYFKMKLPVGILCREAKFEIAGTNATSVMIYNAGVLGKLKNIGVA
jgi:hypothetical protein